MKRFSALANDFVDSPDSYGLCYLVPVEQEIAKMEADLHKAGAPGFPSYESYEEFRWRMTGLCNEYFDLARNGLRWFHAEELRQLSHSRILRDDERFLVALDREVRLRMLCAAEAKQ